MTPVAVWAEGVRLGVRVLDFRPNQGAIGAAPPAYVDMGEDIDTRRPLTRPEIQNTNTQSHPFPLPCDRRG